MPSLRIVADSTVDLPPEVVRDLDITLVPCLLRFGNEVFQEGIDMSREEFLGRLRTDPRFPHTAAPAPGVFEETYRRLADQADAIVSIHLPASYSGIFNAARLGAEAVADEVRVVPVDSSQISLGMGLMTLAAAEAARDGASLQQVLALLEGLKERTHLFAVPSSLDNLRRSGRVHEVVARLGNLLQIKPILHVHQGEVLLQERVRSLGRAQQRLVEIVRSLAPCERVVLAHVQRPEAAEALGRTLGDVLPPRTYTWEAGSTIGIHVGLGAMGVALIRAPR
jgi:DegV family protein with EDD domain